jgi:hypothetical protein
VRDQRVAAARDDEVDAVVQLQKVIDGASALHLRDQPLAPLSARAGVRDHGKERRVAPAGLLDALQDQPVARSDAQARNLGQRVWPRLEDDEQHAQRTGDARELQAAGQLRAA